VMEALFGIKSAFARTPKYRVAKKGEKSQAAKYRKRLKLAPCALVICTSQPALFMLRAFDTAACGFSRSVCTRCPSLEEWIVNVMIDSSRPG